jgi:hypothetical protein
MSSTKMVVGPAPTKRSFGWHRIRTIFSASLPSFVQDFIRNRAPIFLKSSVDGAANLSEPAAADRSGRKK